MIRVSHQLQLLAAFLHSDAGHLRFRDRLQIERCLFRIAAEASQQAGRRLRCLDESRNRAMLRKCRRRALVGMVLRASRLKTRLATVSTTDPYVHRSYPGTIRVERQRELQKLAMALAAFGSASSRLAPATQARPVRFGDELTSIK
jgi:hypothetical protein